LGRPEAVSVSVEEMIYHTQAVARGASRALVVTTLPFGSYETVEQAVTTGVRLMKEGHADAVHMEATVADAPKLKALGHAGVPVMGHLGITKQKIIRTGTIQIQGRTAASAASAVADAVALANAGAFALILNVSRTALGRSSPAAWKFQPSALVPDQTVMGRHWSHKTCWGCSRKCHRASSKCIWT
jgi:3-methyl-2-oxobutanoate hydroxymethyltransferase